MFELPLHIFPGGGFDSSILTVVFVGLLIMWWLTESIGFVFIGLVVPGYLASVMIIAPTTAVVVLVESILTYFIVWLLADAFSKINAWSIFFGRDRFFAFLLVSLFVRLVGELWLWPEAWAWWTAVSGYSPHLPGALTSVGLVLVPLAANMFWKVGAIRGLWQLSLPTAAVYFITAWVLIPLTNLRFSEFQVHYEDVAIDIIASPKAYVIMIVTAAFAARVNIRYGWDFGGILIPALLAISWFDVTKAFTTIGEALLLAALAGAAMNMRPFSRLNLEGPRRIVFVFTLGFFLKFGVGWLVHLGLPHARVTDFFGFGYLLSSLLALKILQKRNVSVVMVPAVAVSIAGFLVGGVLVAVLGLALQGGQTIESEARPMYVRDDSVERHMVARSVLAREATYGARPIAPDELQLWESLLATLGSRLEESKLPGQSFATAFQELGLRATAVTDGDREALIVAEPIAHYPGARGWGIYVFRPGATGPVVLVPSPQGDPTLALATVKFARELDARAIFFGATARTPAGRTLNSFDSPSSPYHIAYRTLGVTRAVEIRRGAQAALHIATSLGGDFPLPSITSWTPSADVVWSTHPRPSLQGASPRGDFVTVTLDLRRVVDWASRGHDRNEPAVSAPLEMWLEEQLFSDDRRFARAQSELGVPIHAAEVEVAQRAVIGPLLDLSISPGPFWERRDLLASVDRIADGLGLDLEEIETGDGTFYALREKGQPARGWGLTLIRADGGIPLSLTIPSPYREASTWRFGAHAMLSLEARTLTLGGIHHLVDAPTLNPPLMMATQRATILDARKRRSESWTVQIRGLAEDRAVETDAIIARETPIQFQPSRTSTTLHRWLSDAGLDAAFDTGERPHSALRGLEDQGLRYSREVGEGRFLRIWLDARFRDKLTPDPAADEIARSARRLGLETTRDLGELEISQSQIPDEATQASWLDLAQRFASTRNPTHLAVLASNFRAQFETEPLIWIDPDHYVWLVARTENTVWGLRLQKAILDVVRDPKASTLRRMTAASLVDEVAP